MKPKKPRKPDQGSETVPGNPWAGLDAALAASSTARTAPPPGYWSVRDLCNKIGRSRAVASNKILLMREAGLLDVWEGSSPNGGRVYRYKLKNGGAL